MLILIASSGPGVIMVNSAYTGLPEGHHDLLFQSCLSMDLFNPRNIKMNRTINVLTFVPMMVSNEVALGPLYVSSALKKAGYNSYVVFPNLFLILEYSKNKYKWLTREIDDFIEKYRPNIVMFSVLVNNAPIAEFMSKYIKKKYSLPIIWGGVHSILEGTNLISEEFIDAVCMGEGEISVPYFINKRTSGELSTENDTNFTYKIDGKIVEANRNTQFCSLEDYPFPDRDPMQRFYDKEMDVANFITSRGCPYKCFYCHAKIMHTQKGYLRFRNPQNVIDEILEVKGRFPIKRIIFSDESFTLNKNNLVNLLTLYREKVALPFECQTRVEAIDENIAKELSNSGCKGITLGIESGDEYIRSHHLNRRMSDEKIINAFRLLDKCGVEARSFNMVGLPEETKATIWKGIDLNRKAKVKKALCTVMMPFKDTEIYSWYEDNNLFIAEPTLSTYTDVIYKHPNNSSFTLLFYAHFFDHIVKSGWTRIPLLKKPKLLIKFFQNLVIRPMVYHVIKLVIYQFSKHNRLRHVVKKGISKFLV